jgi:hypothetical protein
MTSRAWAWLGAAAFILTGAALAWVLLPSRPAPAPALPPVPVIAPVVPQALPPAPAPPRDRDAAPLAAPDAGVAPAPVVEPVPAAAPERPSRARGEQGTAYLIRVLQTTRDFRVRVPAVFALGRVGSGSALAAVVQALSDPHPAVRSAAAETLGRHGNSSVLGPLRTGRDRETDSAARRNIETAIARLEAAAATSPAPVPRPAGGRYYVAIGAPSAARSNTTPEQLAHIELTVRSTVGMLPGVRLAPPRESAAMSRAVLDGGTLQGYHLDVAVSSFESDARGNARATVSIMVATLPGRDMRAIVKGTATVQDLGNATRAATNVLEGAARSAARQLPGTFERAAR